jgi:hypothetical protein
METSEMKTVTAKIKPPKHRAERKSGTNPRLNAHIDPEDLTTIVTVFTSGRSGTSLMASLLDSHPWISATPDCVLMGFYLFWEEFCDLKRDALIEAFIDQFGSLFNGAVSPKNTKSWICYGENTGFTTMGENRDQTLSADTNVFRLSLREMLPKGKTVTRQLFIQALHVAYADAIGHRLEKGAVILFGLHGPSRPSVTAMTEDFPDSRLLHMVRDPIQTLGSHFRNSILGAEKPIPRRPLKVVRARFFSGRPALENVKFQSRAVRLEDLHRAPKRIMSAVCAWLGIPWDDALLQSTFNGLKFWNDSTSAHQVSGFSKEIIAQKHETYIPRFDRFRYTVIFARRFQAFDYCLHNTFLCQRIVFAMLLPLFIFPFRIEMLANKGGWSLESLKYFIKLRLLIIEFTFNPPDTVPLLRANVIDGSP